MKEEKIIEKEVKPTDTAQINILNDQVDNAAKVPKALAKWVWELAYDREQTGRISKVKNMKILRNFLKYKKLKNTKKSKKKIWKF